MSRRSIARAIEDAEQLEQQPAAHSLAAADLVAAEQLQAHHARERTTRDRLTKMLTSAAKASKGRRRSRVDPALVDALLVPIVTWATTHQRLVEAGEEAVALRERADRLEKQGLHEDAKVARMEADEKDAFAQAIKDRSAPPRERVRLPWLWANELEALRAAHADARADTVASSTGNVLPRLVNMSLYGAPTSGTSPSRYVRLEAMAVRQAVVAIPDASLLMMAHVSLDGEGPSAAAIGESGEPRRTWAWLVAERTGLPIAEVGQRVERARQLLRAALLVMETTTVDEHGVRTGDGVPFIMRRQKTRAERDTTPVEACFGPVIEGGVRVACAVAEVPKWRLDGAAMCDACGRAKQ